MVRTISLETIKALRSLRSGTPIDEASHRCGVQRETLGRLEHRYRNVPEDILKHLECALSDRDKLRRLIADLASPLRP
jgi:hypothetical protein